MKEQSLWTRFSDEVTFPGLMGELKVDVAVIGGGICGVTTAALLKDSGLKVAVLEARKIGRSSSGFSTGNLYEVLGEELKELVAANGIDAGKLVLKSRREAVDLIERLIIQYDINCDFRRVPRYFYSSVKDYDSKVEDEAKTQSLLAVPFSYDPISENRLKARTGIVNENQAQFNPQRYVEQLALKINDGTTSVYEQSGVQKIERSGNHFVLETEHGRVIADKVIHATHTPKGVMTYHTLLAPYREFGLAFKLNGRPHPPGIFFGFFDDKSIISTRQYERDGEKFLIVVGGPHKVGQGDSVEEMNRLESFARSHFDVEEVIDRWGAQQYKSTDYLPYIGPKGRGENIYIATGFSSHGLTYGTVAAKVLADEIMGVENEFAKLYSPSRMNPITSAPKFIKENANVFYEYMKDYVLESFPEDFHDVRENEGKVISFDGKKVAVSRDEEGLHVCSAVCPHLGAVVHWNDAEKTWDCPAHGSRFECTGAVLEGPTMRGLQNYELADLENEEVEKAGWANTAGILPTQEPGPLV